MKGCDIGMATYIISGLVFAALAAIVISAIRKKLKGESGCASGCGSCPRSSLCGPQARQNWQDLGSNQG